MAGPASPRVPGPRHARVDPRRPRARRVLAELPLGTADRRLVGHRVEYFQDWLVHEQDEDYWKRLDLRRNAADMPKFVHLASGWYDVCLASVLADYRALRHAGKRVRLVVGPWYLGRGAMDRHYRAEVDDWLHAAADIDAPAGMPVRVHVGGAREWREVPDWPPPGCSPTAWHLQPGRPAGHNGRAGRVRRRIGTAVAKDTRRLERRPDVLTYTSDVLDEDLEVIGPVAATITLRATLEHVELFVRLCDVHPSGRSVNLCDGIRRLRPLDPPAEANSARTVTVDLTGGRAPLPRRAPPAGAGQQRRAPALRSQHRDRRAAGDRNHAARAGYVEIYHASRIVLPHAMSEPS